MKPKRLIVGVTGASGVVMAYHFLKAVKDNSNFEIHLIISNAAKTTWKYECEIPIVECKKLAYKVHEENCLDACISSGSYCTEGIVIIPCSMKTLASVAHGYSDNLISRAADVCIKEKRKIVIVPREMPLSNLHIKNLKEISDLGCAIIPPMLTFYNSGSNISDHINHIIGKILAQFHIEYDKFKPWEPISYEK